jgi:hypothetical protein
MALLGLAMKGRYLLLRLRGKVRDSHLEQLVFQGINHQVSSSSSISISKDRPVSTHMLTHRCKMVLLPHLIIDHYIHRLDLDNSLEIIIMVVITEMVLDQVPINIIQGPCQDNIHRILVIICILWHLVPDRGLELGREQVLVLVQVHLINTRSIPIIHTILCTVIRHSIIISLISIQGCNMLLEGMDILTFNIIPWHLVDTLMPHRRII